MEFVKVIFLKLLSDREIHDSPNAVVAKDGTITVPASEVRFSRRWIQGLERDHPNPMATVQFANLLSGLEAEIREGTKRRIFSPGERTGLSSSTVNAITSRFETVDLYGIDADLNGRMFETFLSATLRGKDLGQYFTPGSIAKLATRLARLRVDRDHVDVVLDGCCGTGGFLVEACRVIDENPTLTASERSEQKKVFAQECLYGVDSARDPALARIARINMYLHGDGGSHIYQLDALDKVTKAMDDDDVELKGEKSEFRRLLADHQSGFADVVLTNPPFAKEYSRAQEPEAELLDEYELAFESVGGRRRPVRRLRSSVMFLERYYDLLVPSGLLVSVVDDGILGSGSYAKTREWLRSHFLVRAVVSLPGDAFQRSQARVKTSLLLPEKRREGTEQQQPPVFMYYCTAIGVDDTPRQRVLEK
jgi:type I restriction enzyme M protein